MSQASDASGTSGISNSATGKRHPGRPTIAAMTGAQATAAARRYHQLERRQKYQALFDKTLGRVCRSAVPAGALLQVLQVSPPAIHRSSETSQTDSFGAT